MIELTRTLETHSEWNVKVLGVGGAGTHAVDRLSRDGLASVEILAANTDARALAAAATAGRIVLGHALTRGLGAGGDPELGRAAALESVAEIGSRLAGASLVILLAGLGGGTGSGATPCIAQAARAQGAHVAVFATLPFSFEGRRRREQALEALDALRQHADLVVCFENDRMPAVADPASGIEDAFQAVDSLLAQAVRAVTSMTRRRNVLHSGIDEIAATVAEHRSTALFGYGVADGEERARAAVARAFGNPLLDSEGALQSISRLWVYVAGGPDMRWSEVQALMSEVAERVSPNVRLFFGAAVDASMEGAISVTLLAGVPGIADGTSVRPPQTTGSALGLAPGQAATFQPAEVLFPSTQPSGSVIPPQTAETERAVFPSAVEASAPSLPPPPANEPSVASQSIVEPVLLPLEIQPEVHAAQQVRSTPVPPFELSKERRREVALHESNFRSHPGNDLGSKDVESAPAPASSQEALLQPVQSGHPQTANPDSPASEEGGRVAEAKEDLEPVLPLGVPRENAKRTKDGGQEQMRFEAPHRGGRFEKTAPTIVDGEDLDVPTFMRQRLPIE